VRKLRFLARIFYCLAALCFALFVVLWVAGKTDSFAGLAITVVFMSFAGAINQCASLHERIIELEGQLDELRGRDG
jgi:phosphatidylserine synthase